MRFEIPVPFSPSRPLRASVQNSLEQKVAKNAKEGEQGDANIWSAECQHCVGSNEIELMPMRDDVVDPFPEQWELLSLFECEPELEDRDLPWAYNRLTFDSTRGSDRILCVIEPSYECLDFTWWHNQTKHLELKLRWVHGITVSSGGGTDFMVATFRDSCLLPLRLQLKPTIECEWGTTHDYP